MKMLNSDNVNLHFQLFLKATLTFVIQVILVILIIRENGFNKIVLGDFTINTARIICGVLLHVIIMPEVRGAFKLMTVAINSKEAFRGSRSVARYTCLLQIIAGFATEWCNLILIVNADNVVDIVKDFIALEVIAHIDNVVFLTVKHINFEQETNQLAF